MALVSPWGGAAGWNSLSSDKLWEEQGSGQGAVVQSSHWYELRGPEKHREEMQTERRKETGKERKGRETPTQAPHSRGTQKMHYHDCWDIIPSGPCPRGPSHLASLFQSAPSPLAVVTSCFHGQVLGSILHLQTLWLAALRLSRCPKAAKIGRIRRKLLCWPSHRISPIALSSDSVFVLPFSETGFFFIPLSSYNLLFLPIKN